MILDVIKDVNMEQQKKYLIIKRVKIISKLFEKYNTIKKDKNTAKSKILVNNQIIGEIKRRMGETQSFYNEKIKDINNVITKKSTYLKKSQKKFNEIQIYIRRESQNFFKYKKMYADFSIKPFLLENESLMRYKKKLKEEEDNKKYNIRLLSDEINEMKNNSFLFDNKYKNIKNKSNNIILSSNFNSANDKLNCYLLGLEDELKNKRLNNEKLSNKNLVYKRRLFYGNDFFRGIENIKADNDIILNTDFSQEIYNNNDVSISVIKKVNVDENLESNMSNTFYDMISTDNIKNFIQDINS